CFAANIVSYLERAGFTYLRTERRNPAFADVESERLGYDNFSAAYGNIYTARQLLQLLNRCLGNFRPIEDRWRSPEEIIDPFRPGLRYNAMSPREFDVLTAQHLRRTLEVFRQAQVFVFTLCLTEAWVSRVLGVAHVRARDHRSARQCRLLPCIRNRYGTPGCSGFFCGRPQHSHPSRYRDSDGRIPGLARDRQCRHPRAGRWSGSVGGLCALD